jgi:hypothetical protein
MDARTLDADVGSEFPEAEASETAELHTPFGCVHDRSLNVTHGPLP